MIQITNLTEERAMAAYIAARNELRDRMKGSVYPNAKQHWQPMPLLRRGYPPT
jgi:hypothetical protein